MTTRGAGHLAGLVCIVALSGCPESPGMVAIGAPSFDPIASQTVVLGTSAQGIEITGIAPWPASGDASTVTLTASSSDPVVVPAPTISGTGGVRLLVFGPTMVVGAATVTVTARQGGLDPFRQSFVITVLPASEGPTFDAIADQEILEDGGPQSLAVTGVAPCSSQDAPQPVTLTATSSDPTIVPDPTVTGTGATRWLAYTPAPDANGFLAITVVARSDGGSASCGLATFSRTFALSVQPVNDAPTFDAITDASVLEDAGAQSLVLTGVSPGPANEFAQPLVLTATSSDPAIVPDPVIVGAGTTRSLLWAPAPNANGVVTVTVTAVDGGGTASGGVDTFRRSFTIAVTPVNDPPTFDPIAAMGVLTGDAPVPVTRILTGVSPGPADEASQTVTFSATSSDPTLVPDPTITGSGVTRSLSFAATVDAVGVVTVTVVARDDGGTALGGADTLTRSFRVALGRSPLVTGLALESIQTIAGGGSGNGSALPATEASLADPSAAAFDAVGNLFIADQQHDAIVRVDAATGMLTVVAGTEYTSGFAGDGGPSTAALLDMPAGVAVDLAGNVFVSDSANQRIRRIDAVTGTITTIAGTGEAGRSGDGGPAVAARLHYPLGLRVDASGNVFFADQWNERVCRIDGATGILTTVAGTGVSGFAGDGGPAAAAQLGRPTDVALDGAGNLFIADAGNYVIRRVDAATGVIQTIAGKPSEWSPGGFAGDGGPASSALLYNPTGVAVGFAGDVFIADAQNQRLRRIDGETGIITTIAGTGTPGFSGDGGPATSATLDEPGHVALDAVGNPFIVDAMNNRVRVVRLAH
jgi:hypothetical protein